MGWAPFTKNTFVHAKHTGNPEPGQLNINTANAGVIMNFCHGIGQVLADRIVAARGMHDPFQSWRGLRDRVPMIGAVKLDEIKQRFRL